MAKRTQSIISICVAAFALMSCAQCASCKPPKRTDPPSQLEGSVKLPDGFAIELISDNVPNARAMDMSPKGTLFVGTRQKGDVYAITFAQNGAHKIKEVHVIARGLNMPAGVDFFEGDLYVSSLDRVLRYPNIESNLAKPPNAEIVSKAFPDDKSHGWKFIKIGPDGKLYVPVGAPCNVCLEDNPKYATVMRMDRDGSNLEVFASGVRNTVGFDWHPKTNELWFTDNGRDWLGDDRPPDELNRAPKKGLHFGFPFCHGGDLKDPEFGDQRPCSEFVAPVQKLGPHVAALGMRFYTGKQFPQKYHNQVFIAEHGSWNRSTPIGYRITLVTLDGNQATSYKTFASGWLGEDGEAWGRPADVLVHPDGSLYVSDDYSGRIYRIYYKDEI